MMRRMRNLRLLTFVIAVACLSAKSQTLSAQAGDGSQGDSAGQSETAVLDQDLTSPRATMITFLEAMDSGRTDEAKKCLDLVGSATNKGEVYTLKLKDILDRMVLIDYDTLPDGTDDEPFSLASYRQLDADHPDFADSDAIRIERDSDGQWRFSRSTVDSLDDIWRRWSDRDVVEGLSPTQMGIRFDERWVESLFPGMRETHFFLPDYQWLCIVIIIVIGFVVDLVTRKVLDTLTGWWLQKFRGKEVDAKKRKLWRPVGLLSQALVWCLGTTLIGLPPMALTVLLMGVKLYAVVAAVWTALLFIDVLSAFFRQKADKTETKFDDLLIPLVTRSLKIFAICIGIITVAQMCNFEIDALIASLGVGGIAIALASQDAVSNFFGSITVLFDRPFEVGDWVIVDGVEGSVETVGFRSTRVRTFYNSLITVPNSKLTTATVDNMGRRRYRRVKTMLGVDYNTSPEQIEAFCEGIRELIRRHPYTRKDYFHVYLNAFNASSLDILLYCFIECPDWSVELREKQRLYLDIMRLAHKLKIQFAFPTRTLHMYHEDKLPDSMELEAAEAAAIGGRNAAQIAGPLLQGSERPGTVEFGGPLHEDNDT